MPINILITEDHTIVREGLRNVLSDEDDLLVVGEAADGLEALKLVKELVPHVVLMDISLPNLNGVEATRRIKQEFPNVQVIALSMHSDDRFVVEMFRSGASGYLLKDCASVELARAIRIVAKGKVYLSPTVAGTVVDELTRQSTSSSAFGLLSSREREVVQLIAEGKTTKEAARHLGLSIKTVESHRRRVMQKLNIDSVAELTKYAVREGLTSL